jgi:hypothetical protein
MVVLVVPVIATIVGYIIGTITTVWVTRGNRKFEQEQAYKKELLSHKDDLFKPLFNNLADMWGSLSVLIAWSSTGKKEIRELGSEIQSAKLAYTTLKMFTSKRYDDMSLLLPSPFPWIFAPLEELLENVFLELEDGNYPRNDVNKAVTTIMTMQDDLKKLLGYPTDFKMETKYPFE